VYSAGSAGHSPGDGASVVAGDTVQWLIGADVNDAVSQLTGFDTMTLTDVLPPGFQYVAGSSDGYWHPDGDVFDGSQAVGEPQIVNNYHQSGRQALIWTYGPLMAASSYPDFSTFTFNTLVTDQITPGVNKNYAYTTWTGGDGVTPYLYMDDQDIFDVNNNGSTTDKVSGSSATVDYLPAKLLMTSVTVQGSQDSSFLVTPQYGTSTADAPAVNYKLTLDDNSAQDITSLTAIDLLPYPTDKTLSPNTDGQTADRGSQFKVRLTGPIVPASGTTGFTVEYTDFPIFNVNADAVNGNATWTTTPTYDWSQVTYFRIKLDPGQVLPQGQTAEFTVPATIPDAAAAAGQFAYNSFATSTDSSAANWAESNLSGVTIYSATPPPPPPTSPTTTPPTTTTTTPPTSTTPPPVGNASPGGATTGGGVTTSRSAAPAVLMVVMGLTLGVAALRRRLSPAM